MNQRDQQRFAPIGSLAVNPKAFGAMFDVAPQHEEQVLTESGVAIVSIRGPLMHHAERYFDSYESIKARVAQAIALQPRMILLDIDSPGGLVSGAFDTAREVRAMCEAASVELRAHVEAQATSAAYAMATAATWIGVSRSASIGSIGVIDTLIDLTAQNEAQGVRVQLVTSGARKADGNPDSPITSEAIESTQARVASLAAMFFDLVVDHGWGGSIASVEALQAAVITGEQALAAGLVSAIATRAESIAIDTQARADAEATETEREQTKMAEPMEDAVASLRKMAEGENEEDAKRAKAALKALGAEEDEPEPDAEDEAPEPDAEDDEHEPDAEDEEKEEARSSASALALATKALAKVHTMEANAAKAKASAERAELIESRPDFAPEMIAVLSSSKTPLATVRELVAGLPKGPSRHARVAAAATATGTRGELQGDGLASRLSPHEKAALDSKMGLTKMTTETVNETHRLTFGARREVSAFNAAGGNK